MAVRELREHLRITSESRAILTLADGSKIRSSVRDLSVGGAYLIRSTQYGPPADVPAAAVLSLWLFHPGRADQGITLQARVVRVEPGGGAGLAIQFVITEEAPEAANDLLEHVAWEAEAQEVPRGALGIPNIGVRTSRWQRFATTYGVLLRAGTLLALFAAARVGSLWLDSVL